MRNVTFKVEGMHCTGCASRVEAVLKYNAGVKRASVSFEAAEAHVLFDPEQSSDDQLAAAIEQAGYRVSKRRATS